MKSLRNMLKKATSWVETKNSSKNKPRARTLQKQNSLGYETLEPRQLLATDTAYLPITSAFSTAETTNSSTVSGMGSNSLVFDINQPNYHGASSNSRLNFIPVPSQVQNDRPTVIGYLDYFNGLGSHHVRYVTVDVKFGANLDPLKIEFYISQDSNGNERIGIQAWPSVRQIATPVGRAKAYVYGVFPSGTGSPPMDGVSSNRLLAEEGNLRRAELRVAFLGIDTDDQFSETYNAPLPNFSSRYLGFIDGEVSRQDWIAHTHDTDTYRFKAHAHQTLAFEITPENRNGYLLHEPQVIVMNANGDIFSPPPRYSSRTVYTFPENGTYFVSIKNKYNVPFHFAGSAENGMHDGLDDISSGHLNPIPNNAIGFYKLKISDADDQISEAITLGLIQNGSKTMIGNLYSKNDVNLYSFQVVSKGQVLAFDFDRISLGGNARLTLIGPQGGRLKNSLLYHNNIYNASKASGSAPFEPNSNDPYLEYRFANPGTYYIAVGGAGNSAFNVINGMGDNNADGLFGRYSLTITNIARTFGEFQPGIDRGVSGAVSIPNNPKKSDGSAGTATIVPWLLNYNDAPIRSGIETWIVIHGRSDSASSNWGLAGALQSRLGSNAQVLLLNWSEGAFDNELLSGTILPLQGSKWIPYVSKWVESVLETGVFMAPSSLSLVGHSWGAYMAYEIASRIEQFHGTNFALGNGKVRTLVALDPAKLGYYYAYQQVNFSAVSRYSFSIYGNGPPVIDYGNARLAKTAHESFSIRYFGDAMNLPGNAHSLPRDIFKSMIVKNDSSPLYKTFFAMSRLRAGNPRGFTSSANFNGFHGRFVVKATANPGYINFELRGFEYFSLYGGTQFVSQIGF